MICTPFPRGRLRSRSVYGTRQSPVSRLLAVAPSRLPDLCLCRSLHHPSFSFFVVSLYFCLLYFFIHVVSYTFLPLSSAGCYRWRPRSFRNVGSAGHFVKFFLFLPLFQSLLLLLLFNLLLIYVASYALFSLSSVSCYPWRPRSLRSFASADLFIIPPSPSSFSSSASVYSTFNLYCLLRIPSLILSRLLRVASSKLPERWFYRSLQSLHLQFAVGSFIIFFFSFCSVPC